ncbi:gamma-glutamylcyclotransferase family protein [Marinobacter lacisalsi]|uniref:Gamma-glutamylcyclotransferase family protein n=1 Tax=Marinobacter lacisalsi TaxID=475979 RepID=A0ABV8QH88_9GAMM
MASQRTTAQRVKLVLLALLATLLVSFSALLFYLWFAMLSPYGYERPETLAAIDSSRDHELFVFGTLTQPWVRYIVMGRTGDTEPAILEGYEKEALDIKPKAGAEVEGKLIEVSPEELARLDRYERLGIRYERVRMTLADGTSAWVYRLLVP